MALKENTLSLLIWEGTPEQSEAHINTLKNLGFALREIAVSSEEQLLNLLDERNWDLLICDATLPDDAVGLQKKLKSAQPELPSLYLQNEYHPGQLHDLYAAGAKLVFERSHEDLLQSQLPGLIRNHQLSQQLEQARIKIDQEEQRNRTLMDSSRDAIAYIQDGMHAYTNLSYLEMFGIEEQDELDCTPLLDLIGKESRDEIKSILRQFNHKEISHTTVDCPVLKNDKPLDVNIDFAEALLEGEPSIQIQIREKLGVNDEELNKKLAELSRKDLITDLDNRRYFIDELREVLTGDLSADSYALIFIRIDGYAELQEELGIAGCDIMLRDIASAISPELKASASLARFAYDSFTSLHPIAYGVNIKEICERVCAAVNNKAISFDNKQLACSVSVGFSSLKTGQSAEKALVDVERACNDAQQQGGNSVKELRELGGNKQNSGTTSEELIKDALKNNQFQLVFQPIVSLHASPGERYQVLIRMLDHSGEEVAPAEFIPVAEKAGLMSMIDRWVVVNSINTLVKQRQDGKQMELYIKLSSESVKNPETVTWINKYLQESRIPGDCITLELNQDTLLTHREESKAFIKLARQLHCKIAIGHVCGMMEFIEELAQYDVDCLKIDGSLISNLTGDKAAQDTTKKIATLAQANNKQTIAEFVHDASTLALLWQHGVNYVQGYYLQQPAKEMCYNFDG